ncbi:hypothetical protein BATDEDRAFT_25207 [Batrachochytrium dendrobatidis JAM81]|uniref:CST complex subunit STN1 n=2 Tax=Batrachochytrium dendrobatidis TaxID=109871 RepID=F4P3V7_BATDJ|nr:uncharacterized protein BATDEDRAFT_25207 [Batrachochytrium dendrobatidis JAM81]EGF80542.1 hypothetical protein BATDEDRAFT_25207 [Batrachochytrium dendrobatidis JAM81]|eukprot:XP_006679057.1 hypothetical protein BATDEDRAFT_25207 [Batrachochytrium dendrobatidis JAM81]
MSVHQSSKYIRYSEWNNSHTSTNDTQHLGDLVCIMGRLSTFEDERHITIHSIAHQTNPNYETTEWLTVMSLKQDVYDKPLVVPKSIKQAVISKYGTDAAQDSTVKQVTNENKQFVDALQDHIGALPDSAIVHFSKTSQDAQLRLAAIQSLKNKTTDANKQTQLVARQFSYGFKRMVEQGILALRDEESDTYEKITHQGNLGIEILEIIRQESRQAKSRMKGVSQDFVVLRLQEQQRFQRVPKLRIIESIQQLNSTADIYSVDATHYAAV